ncbi:hypothetical protein CDES_07745 [Corynebacterium deserti GIMN1.010]|uniref:Uncharacterized protein n=1 Tax=Corynebacterium deserti GIMN1.010 TaxID=931089 RepID=A0A0M4CE22_9CORY|nr:hypothetical protein [Corynebacterium deserti]ALC05954.1 hypothetical protein CDES_07745 [Corynebacterium deserti GIMN1.010]
MLHDVSSPFPLHDADRYDIDREGSREVIQELGIPEPHTPNNDSWARLPMRITTSAASGITLELGPYDFSGQDFLALEHAVNEMRAILDGYH